MIKQNKPLVLLLCVSLCAALLCGCSKKIELSQGKISDDSTHISAVVTAEDVALLDKFHQLQSADFSGSTCYEEIIAWAAAHPQVDVTFTVSLPDGQIVAPTVKSLDLSRTDSAQLEGSFAMLKYFSALEEVSLPQHVGLEQLNTLSALYPQLKLNFSVEVSGIRLSNESKELNFSSKYAADAEAVLPWLAFMPEIEKIDFGEENGNFSWDIISAYRAACPEAVIDYSFELYGKYFTLSDEKMDLNHIDIDDEGALVKQITGCMNNLQYLDMDSCGVSNEAMAEIRDSLPNTKVVWRVWFGERYSVRTDVTKILASNPGMGGELLRDNVGALKYCTEVRYLDLGHNNYLDDVSFIGYMPKLEVVILAMDCWGDISAIANCTNLEYAELQTTGLNDLRPLAELKNLKHLNICYCLALTDLSPIYGLNNLERLWIGNLTPIPREQVEEFKRLNPNCEVNTATLDPTDGGWRMTRSTYGMVLHPRYKTLTEQFEYVKGNEAYAYYYNDPLY